MRSLFVTLLLLTISASSAVAGDALPALKIQKLTDSVYLHTSYKVVDGFGLVDSNGLLVLVGNDAYIIDTPWSAEDTEKLLAWIKGRGLIAKGSVSTHFHDDRTAGIAALNDNSIPTYASSLTNDLLEKAGKAQASNTFDNSRSFWLVKDEIEVFYPGPGHSEDNVVVWLPKHATLLGGCFVRAAESSGLGNVSDAFISQWPRSAEKLQAKYPDARLVIPGHGQVADASLLEHTRALALEATSQPLNTAD